MAFHGDIHVLRIYTYTIIHFQNIGHLFVNQYFEIILV